MTEAINAHKKMAMGMTEGNKMKKGGSVRKFAAGGAVMKEGGVANLPAKGSAPPPFEKSSGTKIATYAKGGAADKKGFGLTIAVAVPMRKPAAAPMRKAAGRGR